MNKYISILILFLSIGISAQTQQFVFKNGQFKIIQFADLHWANDSDESPKTIALMETLIKKEQPNLVVLTGDNITFTPAKNGWNALIQLFEKVNVNWTMVFGNHDEEHDMKKTEIYDFLKTSKYFVGEKGNVSGVGNFSLPIFSRGKSNPSAILYFLDSHDYTGNPKLGKYAWIKNDQINWYRNQSQKFTKDNGNIPLPSLMFFHIPFPEYAKLKDDPSVVGIFKDDVSSPEINSGLFNSIIEMKDVMGTFVGHDHNNNFIGNYKNVALAYGNKTGKDGYGDVDRNAARVIVLKEGKFAFQSYISTPTENKWLFNYPSGLAEVDIKNMMKAQNVSPRKNGISYSYYEGHMKSTKELATLKPKKSGTTSQFNINMADAKDHFGIKFKTWLKIPETGKYRFSTYSDDGSLLKINGRVVVDNDGSHGARHREGVVDLEKGFHLLEVDYFEDYMGEILDVQMSSINIPEGRIPEQMMYLP